MSAAVQCEQCATVAKLIDTPAGPQTSIPVGWIQVYRVGGTGPQHFCGWVCCAQWAAMAHAIGEPGPA